MNLPELNLNKIEEFKNFSLNEVFGKEYEVKIGGDIPHQNSNDKFKDFLIINIVNGVPVLENISNEIEIKEFSFREVRSYNPIPNLNKDFQSILYEIQFKKCPSKPVVLVNYITDISSFIPGNIRFSVNIGGTINILEVTEGNLDIDEVFINNNREFNINNSFVNYSRADKLNKKSSIFNNYYGYVDNGTLNCISLDNTGSNSMNNWDVDLISADSNCYVSSVIKLKDKMRHGSICKINHLAENSISNQEFRHVLDDDCYAMYDGDSTILNVAKNSSTAQKSRTIMLSDNARILNKPRLNIYTSEVKATHGASVGKLNDDDIFYLKQRGLPDNIIKELLVDAFVIDLINNIESEKIRGYLYDKR